ncbi:MAG: GNAT family N-acetyltransferase, partial [Candidatus Kariarchaeaceae archaeon]
DYVVKSKPELIEQNDTYHDFCIKDIEDRWKNEHILTIDEITLRPLKEENLKTFVPWMNIPETKQTLIGLLPATSEELHEYFFNPNRKFFSIFYNNDELIGFIGAHKISKAFKKIEMKKYIGCEKYRKRGFGKKSTFLFLYYVFEIIKFNKINIYSIDTNIRNVNLNSKFGFELEGVLFNEIFYDDHFRDVLRMGLHQNKWENIFLEKEL